MVYFRFFIIKEGFLLYYPESEKKLFEKRGGFNIHPRGAVPLAGCTIVTASEPGQNYVINVRNEEFINVSLQKILLQVTPNTIFQKYWRKLKARNRNSSVTMCRVFQPWGSVGGGPKKDPPPLRSPNCPHPNFTKILHT